ncbi:MAG: hypothetical protein AVO33_08895 [delta proteobacterium ML8_F1]|nr:MAG: hypothetical protein AVO33_08895 [delta proteobacterium ML8_F1]
MRRTRRLGIILSVLMIFSSMTTGLVFAETYTVQSGDTLSELGVQWGVDWRDIADLNDLDNPDLILEGQELEVPGTTPTPEVTEAELTILHTNDVHGFYVEGKYDGMGAAKVSAFVESVRESDENVLFFDAGDALQGANLVTLSDGRYGTYIMNEMGYDLMVAGNHEFDYGVDRLMYLARKLDFPMLGGNVIVDETGESLLPAYTTFEKGGYTIGVFGIATPETTYKSHPDNTRGLTFQDPVAYAQEMVDELRDEVDVLVALVHLGLEGDYTSKSVAEQVDGIDLMIDGHSHTNLPEGMMVEDTMIVQAGEKSKNVGIVQFHMVDGAIDSIVASQFSKADSLEAPEHERVGALVDALNELNGLIENEVVGFSPMVLNGETEFVRTGETNLGNLLTEALLDISGADIALTNGGGIRTSIQEGEVTKGDVLQVLPFGNTVRVIKLSGADVMAAVENGIASYPEPLGAFPHIAGMTVTFDATQDAGSRVVEILVDGEPLVESAMYTLATNDFLVAGGDGYSMFTGKQVVAEFGAMDQVLIDYMANVGFDKASVTGRIVEINE